MLVLTEATGPAGLLRLLLVVFLDRLDIFPLKSAWSLSVMAVLKLGVSGPP